MVTPDIARRVVTDAARLVKRGEIVVFGSASLAFWLKDAPRSRDVDVWVEPEDRGEMVEALMGELSWYHERHDAYVEVLGPETFCAPRSWRDRARQIHFPEAPEVTVLVPHPHDVLVSKLGRLEPHDRDHVERILKEMPIDVARLDALASESPYRARAGEDPNGEAAFELHLQEIRHRLPG